MNMFALFHDKVATVEMLCRKTSPEENAEGHSKTCPTHLTGTKSQESTSITIHTTVKVNKLHAEKVSDQLFNDAVTDDHNANGIKN